MFRLKTHRIVEIFNDISDKQMRDRVIYTALICYIQMAFGITCTSVSPCLVDIKNMHKQKDMTHIFYYNSVNSVGYITGSLCGFVCLRIRRQIRIIFLLALIGTALIFLPHVSLYLLYLCGFIIGVGGGSWDSCFNVWVIELWPQKSGPFLQLTQFAFGIGSIIGPLIEKPFVIGDNHNDSHRNHLAIPFAIIGAVQLLGAIFMSVMVVFNRCEIISQNQLSLKNTKSDDRLRLRTDRSGAKAVIALCALCLAAFTALENCYFQFSPTFHQYIALRLCAQQTALILSVMASCFTIGRGISVLIAMRLTSETIITYHYCLILVSLIILLFAQNSLLLIYVGNVLIGFGLSALWASILSFIHQYIEITEQISSVFILTVGALSTSTPLIIGPIIQSQPMILIYLLSFCVAVSVLAYISMVFIVYRLSEDKYSVKNFDNNCYTIELKSTSIEIQYINAIVNHSKHIIRGELH